MMRGFTFSLLSFTLFLSALCQRIEIFLPSTLRTWINSDNTTATIMPFGHVPYPTNACNMMTIEDKPRKLFIVVAQRDSCDPYIKAQNAEKAGAGMLIITDNTGEGFPIDKLHQDQKGLSIFPQLW